MNRTESLLQECLYHGDIFLDECYCDVAWFGDSCDISVLNYHPNAFIIWQSLFFGLFGVLGLRAFYGMYTGIQKTKKFHYLSDQRCKFYLTVLKSPINISMSLIMLISIAKMVWLAVDPFSLHSYFPRSLERTLAEIVYSFLFCLYGVILLAWYIIYDEISYNVSRGRRKCICRGFKLSLKIRILFTCLIQILTSIGKGLRPSLTYRILFFCLYGILYCLFFYFIIEFFIYGYQVYRCLKEVEGEIDKRLENIFNNKEKVHAEHKGLDHLSGTIYFIQDNNKKALKGKDGEEKSKDKSKKQDKVFFDKSIMKTRTIDLELKSDRHIPNGVPSIFVRKNKGHLTVANVTSPKIENLEFPIKLPSINLEEINKNPQVTEIQMTKKPHKSIRFDVNPVEEDKKKFNFLEGNINESVNIPVKGKLSESHLRLDIENEKSFIFENTGNEVEDCWSLNKKDRFEFYKSKQLTKSVQESNNFTKYRSSFIQKAINNAEARKEEHKSEVEAERKQSLSKDKLVIKKILSLTTLGIIFEVIFAFFSIVIYATKILNDPAYLVITLFMTSGLEFLSCVTNLKLFTNIKSKELENLRWISRIGSNKTTINKYYHFKMSQDALEKDHFKKIFENRINFLSTPEENLRSDDSAKDFEE